MAIVGVIAEFDPLHTGHAHLLRRLREQGAEKIVVCLGSSCSQRGGFYLLDDETRTRAALQAGADLVVELPAPYSGAGAEQFAAAGVCLLAAVGCDALGFGAEYADSEQICRAARILLEKETDARTAELTKQGTAYAAARRQAVYEKDPKAAELLNSPNTILAVEYQKAILNQNRPVSVWPVARAGAGHGSNLPAEGTVSGSFLRAEYAKNGSSQIWQRYLPRELYTVYAASESEGNFLSESAVQTAILALLRAKPAEEYFRIRGLSEGVENRLRECVRQAGSLSQLEELLATKRYPRARMRRLYMDAALGYTAALPYLPPYIHVMGARKNALSLLKNAALPCSTSAAELKRIDETTELTAEACARARDLFALSQCTPGPMGSYYSQKPVLL